MKHSSVGSRRGVGGGEGKEESEKIVEYICNVQLAANRRSKCQYFFHFSFINDNRKNISFFVF